MTYIGVDGGLSGALAAIDQDGKVIAMLPMPTEEKSKGNEVDAKTAWKWIEEISMLHGPIMVILETPGKFAAGVMSLTSMWDSYGVLRSILATRDIRHERIPPQKWQKVMIPNCAKGDTKKAALQKVKQLWPGLDLRRTHKCKKLDEGFIDALLIAEFGRRTL